MIDEHATPKQNFLTRRELMKGGMVAMAAAWSLPRALAKANDEIHTLRVVNVMNFIRAEEPREPMDLMKPVREQMACINCRRVMSRNNPRNGRTLPPKSHRPMRNRPRASISAELTIKTASAALVF